MHNRAVTSPDWGPVAEYHIPDAGIDVRPEGSPIWSRSPEPPESHERHERHEPPERHERHDIAAWSILAIIGIAAIICVTANHTIPAVVAVVALMLVVPGLGAYCAFGLPAGPRRITSVLLVSFCWATLVGLVTAYSREQNPTLLFVAISAPGAAGAAYAIVRSRAATEPLRLARSQATTGAAAALPMTNVVHRHSRRRLADASKGDLLQIAAYCLVALSLTLCILASLAARGRPIGTYGLLPVLGLAFDVSVLAATLAVVAGMYAIRFTRVPIVAGATALAFAFAAPPALVSVNFLGGWNYKHLGVVSLIHSGHPINDPHDLFQGWPGFFSVAANIVSISGKDPLTYANWATFLFLAVGAFAVYVTTVQLYPGNYVVAGLAAVVFECIQWGGQLYYSPQSYAFDMALLVLATIAPVLVRSAESQSSGTGRWARFRNWTIRGTLDDVALDNPVPPISRLERVALFGGFVAIVVTHQLTPYMVLAALGPFVLIGRLNVKWRIEYAVFALTAVLYLVIHRGALGGQSIFSGFSLANAQGKPAAGPTSGAQVLARHCARVVAVIIWGSAAISVISYRKRIGRVLIPAIFAFTPMSMVLVQNYSGEAIYRVWLFSSPWCALILLLRIWDLPRARVPGLVVISLFSCAAFFASAQATNFGMYPVVRTTSNEIAASRWFYATAPAGARFILATPSFPQRLDSSYVAHALPGTINEPDLTDDPELNGAGLDKLSASELAAYVKKNWGADSYVAVANSMEAENEYYGELTQGTLPRLTTKLANSPDWQIAYQNSDAVIFRLKD